MDVNLVLLKKDGSNRTFALPSHVTVIGRRHDCDLRIPLMPVSRRHCELSLNKDSVKVRDLDSRSGTFLNGKRIAEAMAQAGDYITIGPLTFVLQIDGVPEEIVPPEPAERKPAPKKTPRAKAPTTKAPPEEPSLDEPSDSFPELELDESDSFAAEVEDL